MNSAILADVVVVLHTLYAGFVLFGFLAVGLGWALAWGWVRNFRFRIIHVAAIALVGAQGLLGVICPLTSLEYHLRRTAGMTPEEGAFIARLAGRLLYHPLPAWVFTTSYVALTLLAVTLLFLVPPRRARG